MIGNPRELVELWPSLEAMSDDFKADGLDISATAISKWAQRSRIGGEYWLPLVRIAERRGISGVTFEVLALMHAKSTSDRESSGAEARAG